MKFARLFFIFLLVFMFLSSVAAVEIEVKDSVKKGENFIVKISGTFTKPITWNQVEFDRRGASTSFGKVDLMEIEGDYYFFLEIPLEKTADDYTMTIKDVSYRSGREIVESDLVANFEILDEVVPFSISPPLIITSEKYSVELENLMPNKITIDLQKKALPVETTTEEPSESEPENESESEEGFFDILFNAFSSDENVTQTENITENETGSPITGQVVSSGEITLKEGETKTLELNPPTEKGFEKLELYYNNVAYGALVYNPESQTVVIDEEENETSNITVENETEENATITYVIDESKTNENNTEIIVTENGSIINTSSNEVIGSDTQTCKELNGNVCSPGRQMCSGDSVDARANKCCLGKCQTIKKTSTGKLIGWIIITVIVLFLVWFVKQKYMRSGPGKVDLLNP